MNNPSLISVYSYIASQWYDAFICQRTEEADQYKRAAHLIREVMRKNRVSAIA